MTERNEDSGAFDPVFDDEGLSKDALVTLSKEED